MKIAHLADLHLGFRAYHRVTPTGMNVREADVAAAFASAVDAVVDLRPDVVLVAGDVFHSVRPSNAAIAGAFRQFTRLAEGLPGVPVVIIAGNHDSPRSADTGNILHLFREIPGVTVVSERAEAVRLPEIEASVLCLPHNALTAGEESVPIQPDPAARHNLLMLHGTVGGEIAERKIRYVSEYGGAKVEQSSIGAERWSYVALGHYHIVTELAENLWYAGGIERTSTNPWLEAGGEKGFLLHDTDDGRTRFHRVPTRDVVDLPRLSARGMAPAEVDEAIARAVEGIPGGIAGKMVRLVLTDIPRAVTRELSHRRIREWKSDALHFHLDARPPEVRRRAASGAPVRRMTLEEQVESWLSRHWEVSGASLDRARLVELGTGYVRAEDP